MNLEHRLLSMTGLDQIIHLLKFKEQKIQKRETIVFENNDAIVQSKVFIPN